MQLNDVQRDCPWRVSFLKGERKEKENICSQMSHFGYENTLSFAKEQDEKDALSTYRDQFFIPQINGEDSIYFATHSLGLQPKNVSSYVMRELSDWATRGVNGHFDPHKQVPWADYHSALSSQMARIVGAEPSEVVVMNSLTVNLHLLMVSFYRPTLNRYKVICEQKAFSSDYYAISSQVRFHGFDPDEAIVEVAPQEGKHCIYHGDIVEAIEAAGDRLAMVLIGGVHYYSGQFFDLPSIVAAAHQVGATCGFDLAHAAGNVPLELHQWKVDFAAWCSYKYLNSGPGGVAGLFVHQRHATQFELPRFAGWWGHERESRFEMKKDFVPTKGAEGWQLSNPPILQMAAHRASLALFDTVGMEKIRSKSEQLTAYLAAVVQDVALRNRATHKVAVITPAEPHRRGAQLSIEVREGGKRLFDALVRQGVVADWREPHVIRLAPAPLYNTFEEVYHFGQCLENALSL